MSDAPEDPSNPTLTVAKARALVSPYFPREWSQVRDQDVDVRRVTGGFVNMLHLVSRSKEPGQRDPISVLIRHFGMTGDGKDPRKTSCSLSAAEQAVVYFEMGRRGWGPRIYGLFSGGRLEEYVDAHSLTAAESMLPQVGRDVARSFARLHSLHLPLRRTAFADTNQELIHGMQNLGAKCKSWRDMEAPAAIEFADMIQETDWEAEFVWTSGPFIKYRCKETVVMVDTNFLNILVKNFESECRIMLIDYEMVAYMYRGIDIGGYFTERMYCWSHPESKLTGYAAPDMEKQRSFCEEYLSEMRHLGQSITEVDTVSQLLLESRIGQMYQILFSVLMGVVLSEELTDLALLAGLAHQLQYYFKLKQEYLKEF